MSYLYNTFYALFLAMFLVACGGDNSDPVIGDNGIKKVPVVVHVLYENDRPSSNISDEQIASQLVVLNQDFRALNADLQNVPNEFKAVIADSKIEFELATHDPNGNLTNGITRTLRKRTTDSVHKDLHFTELGGQDAWATQRYLNIWVVDGEKRGGGVIAPGSGQFPGGDPLTDGIVVIYQAFGTLPPLEPKYTKGRTVTHEVGHWLNLMHIYTKQGSCNSSDQVDDTPTQMNPYSGNPAHPVGSCGSNDMFMNFMDLSDDESLLMFTKGQKARMRAVLNKGGARSEIVENN